MAKLRQLLLSNDLRRYIDLHSDGKASSDSRHSRITWDRLFNQVTTLVQREVEHCIKPVTNRRSSSSQQGSSKATKMSKVLILYVCFHMHARYDYSYISEGDCINLSLHKPRAGCVSNAS